MQARPLRLSEEARATDVRQTIPRVCLGPKAMLTHLERIALEYGMHLNTIKTELLVRPHDHPALHFLNGSQVPTKEVVKYLGSLVTWKKSFHVAFKNRAGLAEEAYKKLRLVWNSAEGSHQVVHISVRLCSNIHLWTGLIHTGHSADHQNRCVLH